MTETTLTIGFGLLLLCLIAFIAFAIIDQRNHLAHVKRAQALLSVIVLMADGLDDYAADNAIVPAAKLDVIACVWYQNPDLEPELSALYRDIYKQSYVAQKRILKANLTTKTVLLYERWTTGDDTP